MICGLFFKFVVSIAVLCACFAYEPILRMIYGKAAINYCDYVIVITGCDTGFGELACTDLASIGFHVIASSKTQEGAKRLQGKVAVSCVCDVTIQEDIDNLAATTLKLMTEKNLRLWAVINNAGIAKSGFLDWLSMDAFREVMEVNYFGIISVTKAMLPMLKKTRSSRIINICSVAGVVGSNMLSAYSGSKHAVEGLTKCIRQELIPWGIHVCNVNPSFFRTPIVTESKQIALEEFNKAPEEVRCQYPGHRFIDELDAVIQAAAENPMGAMHAIREVVTDNRPAMWNYVGTGAWILRFFLMLPRPVQELAMSLKPVSSPLQETILSVQGPRPLD